MKKPETTWLALLLLTGLAGYVLGHSKEHTSVCGMEQQLVLRVLDIEVVALSFCESTSGYPWKTNPINSWQIDQKQNPQQ